MKNLQLKIRISYVMICLLSVFGFTGTFSEKVSAKPVQPSFPIVSGMQKISDNVFVSTGEYIKVSVGLIVSGKEAAIIDTGLSYEGYSPDEALRVKKYLEDNNLKLKYILLTHRHDDHVGNISMFENKDTITFDSSNTHDGQLIDFGDKTFKILRTDGHFNNEHISIELVKQNILFAGDVVVTNLPSAVAFQGNFKGLVPTLEMLRTKNYSIIVPGHGDIINPHEAIKMDLEYLKNVKKYVTRIIKRGGTLEDVMKIKLEDCMKNTKILDQENMQIVHEWSLETAYYEFVNQK